MEKEHNNKEINESDIIPVKIIKEKKQMSVRFPSKFAEKLDINPEKDSFVWILEKKEGISLMGRLIKDKNLKEDEKED